MQLPSASSQSDRALDITQILHNNSSFHILDNQNTPNYPSLHPPHVLGKIEDSLNKIVEIANWSEDFVNHVQGISDDGALRMVTN